MDKRPLIFIFSCLFTIIAMNAHAAITFQYFIDGVKKAPELNNIQQRLKVHQGPYEGKMTLPVVKQLYVENRHQIKQALAPFGYLKPTIESALYHRSENWQAHYKIDLGPALKITQLSLILQGAGKYDPAFNKLLEHLPIKKNAIFNAENYNKTKQKLYNLSIERGYFQAKMMKSKIKIDKKTYHCYIFIIFNTGPRYRFGEVYFSKSPLATRFLKRYVPFKRGEPFQENVLQQLQNNLESGSYFERVSVKPQPHQVTKNLDVPIEVKLTPLKPKRYSFGVGYGTDTGPRALLGVNWRNVTSTGHQFKAETRVSYIQQTLNTTYTIPGIHPATDQYHLFATGQKYNDKSTGQFYNSGKIGASYATLMRGWQTILSLNAIAEHYQLNGYPSSNAVLFMPSLQVTRTHSDDILRPTKGYNINFLVRSADSKLFSTTSFYQAQANFKWLRSFTKNQRVLLQSTVGYTGITNINDLPLSLQFSAGGSESLRGYQYRKLIYGRYITVLGAELQQHLFGNVYLLGFADTGTVSNKIFGPWVRSAGPGMMWLSPVGAIKLTLAKPFDATNKKAWVIQFNMGPEL